MALSLNLGTEAPLLPEAPESFEAKAYLNGLRDHVYSLVCLRYRAPRLLPSTSHLPKATMLDAAKEETRTDCTGTPRLILSGTNSLRRGWEKGGPLRRLGIHYTNTTLLLLLLHQCTFTGARARRGVDRVALISSSPTRL